MNRSRRQACWRLVASVAIVSALTAGTVFAQTMQVRVKVGPANIYDRQRTSSDVVMTVRARRAFKARATARVVVPESSITDWPSLSDGGAARTPTRPSGIERHFDPGRAGGVLLVGLEDDALVQPDHCALQTADRVEALDLQDHARLAGLAVGHADAAVGLAVMVVVGLYIRLGILETPAFTRLVMQGKLAADVVPEGEALAADPASTFRNSERQRIGRIQSASLAQAAPPGRARASTSTPPWRSGGSDSARSVWPRAHRAFPPAP